MTSFSASDAALSGFRFIGRQPRVILVWALVLFGYEMIYGGLLVGFGGAQLSMIRALDETNRTNPAAAMAMLPSVGLISLISLSAWLSITAVLFTAAYRATLHPEEARAAFLRVGGDEFRMAVLIVLWVALTFGYGFLVLFVFTLIGALGMGLPSPLNLLFLAIAFGAGLCAVVYPLVRLVFSMPMTFRDRHLRLLESWKLTRDQAWPILGACLLSMALYLVVVIAEWAIVAVVAAVIAVSSGLSLQAMSGLFSADTSSLATFFVPTTIIAAVLNALTVAAGLAILTAPVSEAYLAIGAPVHEQPHPAASGAA
jgi:hypothetical protein